jgi:hypothetical protein
LGGVKCRKQIQGRCDLCTMKGARLQAGEVKRDVRCDVDQEEGGNENGEYMSRKKFKGRTILTPSDATSRCRWSLSQSHYFKLRNISFQWCEVLLESSLA